MATQLEEGHVPTALSEPMSEPPVPPVRQVGMKERFYRYFQEEATALQEQMILLEQSAPVGGERKDAIDHCLAGISRLSSEVSDASDYLPPYDQRTYSQAVKALQEKLEETRAKITPKSRFSFKTSQKNNSAISLSDAAELAGSRGVERPSARLGIGSSTESSIATTPAHLLSPANEVDSLGDLPTFSKNNNEEMKQAPRGPIRHPSFSQASSVSVSDHTGLHIILPSSASNATSSGSLTNLNRCIVDMSVPTNNGAPFAGLTLRNIQKSLIVAGQVAGAAHITGVEDSVIAVSARQVRMHECKNVDIYLLCPSRPIIENCSTVRFAPLPEIYLHARNTDGAVENQWNQVDDFKWLKVEQSPNWSIMPESERLSEEVWTKVVPGVQGMGLDDILRNVGVKA